MTAYQDRVNAEWLANQAPPVQKTAKDILEELKNIERCLYWAFDPGETDAMREQWSSSLIEHAHALLDLGHAYKASLAANPPPREDDDVTTGSEDGES